MNKTNIARLLVLIFIMTTISSVMSVFADTGVPTSNALPVISDDGYLFEESFSYSDCDPIYDASRATPDPTGLYASGLFETQSGIVDVSIDSGALKFANGTRYRYMAIPDEVITKTSSNRAFYAKVNFEGNTFITFSETVGNTNSAHNLLLRFSGGEILISQPTGIETVKITKNTDGVHEIYVVLNSNNTFSFWFDGEKLVENLQIQKNPESFNDIKYLCFKSASVSVDEIKFFSAKEASTGDDDDTAPPLLPNGLPGPSSLGFVYEETFSYSDCAPIYDSARTPADPTGLYASGLFDTQSGVTDISIDSGALKFANGTKYRYMVMSDDTISKTSGDRAVFANINFGDNTFMSLSETMANTNSAHNLLIRFAGSEIIISQPTGTDAVRIPKNTNGNHSVLIILNINNTFSFWFDGEKLVENLQIQANPESFDDIKYICFKSTSVSVDDMLIYTTKEPSATPPAEPTDPETMPQVSADGYLFYETFTYDDYSPIYDENRLNPDPTGLYASGLFGTQTGIGNISTTNGALKIDSLGTFGYLVMPDDVLSKATDNIVISAKLNLTGNTFISFSQTYANMNTSQNFMVRLSGGGVRFSQPQGTSAIEIPKNTNGEHEILIYINNDYRFYFWFDGEMLASDLPIQTNPQNYSDMKYFCFKGSPVEVDELKVYTASDNSFYKVDRALRGMKTIDDIAVYAEDDSISSFAYSSDNVSIIFGDSASGVFVNSDGGVTLPLKDTLTDVTVTVKSDTYTQKKVFKDVTIPAFYVFGDVTCPVAIFDGAVNEFIYSARARRQDNQPAINIVAVLYDADGSATEIKRLSNTTESLNENGKTAKGFVFGLDLTEVSSIPENALVRIYVWDNMTNMNSLVPTLSFNYDAQGQIITALQGQ